ncbi:MAG TPA: hypothetical protein VJ779_07870 [Acetobacteraceae bacterium]|nr:hypothetical protein [Acetobacteraceae bacterium]
MSPLVRTTGIAGLTTTGLGMLLAASMPSVRPSPPAVVTTDTRAYCQELSEKLSELIRIAPRPPEDEVLNMRADGRHLCQEGQVRGGILRLRRGVMVMIRDLDQRGEP